MQVLYDSSEKRLVCYRKKSDNAFWDIHWSKEDILRSHNSMSKYNLVIRVTKKYIHPDDGPILEGGCGVGQFVYLLSEGGYECIGIDTAEKTIKRVQRTNPSLNLKIMDVRDLKFPDNYLAGYWSMGVIEHFFHGYNDILNEMHRVVKPGGYLFVTVPVMSVLRRVKAYFGFYERVNNSVQNDLNKSAFYQFILPHEKIINDFKKKGLKFVEMRSKGGIKGLNDEIMIFKSLFRLISELRNKNIVFKSLSKLLEIILSPLAGHMKLFVFRK